MKLMAEITGILVERIKYTKPSRMALEVVIMPTNCYIQMKIFADPAYT